MIRKRALVVLASALAAAACALGAGTEKDARVSGFAFMTPSTQAMQRDETQNPGMLWVSEGETLWNRKAGASDKSCASCHGDAATSMRGVATRYPVYDAEQQRPIDLAQRINACRKNHQQAEPYAFESKELLSLESFVAHESQGMAIAPPHDMKLEPFRERGRQRFQQRMGQLDLACAQCHDGNWDNRIAGNPITQAHPTGYPIYRLEWQTLGSLQRRLRNCMSGIRAEPYAYGSPELTELEVYLAWRARGMTVDAPAVRP